MHDLRQMQNTVRDGRWLDQEKPTGRPNAVRPWWLTGVMLALGLLPGFVVMFYFVYL
jgi:hypothetical protein